MSSSLLHIIKKHNDSDIKASAPVSEIDEEARQNEADEQRIFDEPTNKESLTAFMILPATVKR
jgi:hypothetical protein